MPFTPTHALAAVPLARLRALTSSALAIGTMTPDLPMFLKATPSYATTHSWGWGPISCLPYGLLLFALFRCCRGPAIAFAPRGCRERLAPYAAPALDMSMRGWASVVLSIALGVLTHIVWDGFTHAHRFGSALWPALNATWLSFAGQELPGYKLLQYGSSAVGLPLLVGVMARWYRKQPAGSARSAMPAASATKRVLAIALLLGAPLVMFAIGRGAKHGDGELLAYYVVTRTISAYLIGFVALTLPRTRSSPSSAMHDHA
jgi:hypothetical protein